MTNNEKVSRMVKSVATLITAMNSIYEGNLCSAEWIYLKARRETLLDVLGRLERIADEK